MILRILLEYSPGGELQGNICYEVVSSDINSLVLFGDRRTFDISDFNVRYTVVLEVALVSSNVLSLKGVFVRHNPEKAPFLRKHIAVFIT